MGPTLDQLERGDLDHEAQQWLIALALHALPLVAREQPQATGQAT